MNCALKGCIGYVAFSNLYFKHSFGSFKIPYFLKASNVTLSRALPSSSSVYRYLPNEYPQQEFDALLALDFEASIAKATITDQEIIEFPCVWIDSKTMKTVKTFHRYVRPVVHENLDPFVTDLTGITDDMLQDEEPFYKVLKDFQWWYEDLKCSTKAKKTVFVTCGNWDLKVMLPNQCRLSKLDVPEYMRNWINVKTSFVEVTGKYPRSLKEMVSLLDLQQIGRPHRGIDDTLNVVNIVKALAERGHVFHT